MDSKPESAPRPDLGLRLIVAWKATKAALLLLVSIGAFALIHRDLHALGLEVVSWLHLDPEHPRVDWLLAKLTGVTPKQLGRVGGGAILYAAFLATQAYGLHRRRVWAEWLVVGATSALVPVEVFQLATKPSLGKLGVLVLNVIVVLYLLRHRFLFVPGPIGRWLHERFGPRNPGGTADVSIP